MALLNGEEDTDGVHGVEQAIEAVGVEVVDEREDPLVRSPFDLVQQAPTLGSERHHTLPPILRRDRSAPA